VSRPLGYVVPAELQDVLETLHRHGIQLEALTKDTRLEVEYYEIGEIEPAAYDYLPPMKIDVSKKRHTVLS